MKQQLIAYRPNSFAGKHFRPEPICYTPSMLVAFKRTNGISFMQWQMLPDTQHVKKMGGLL